MGLRLGGYVPRQAALDWNLLPFGRLASASAAAAAAAHQQQQQHHHHHYRRGIPGAWTLLRALAADPSRYRPVIVSRCKSTMAARILGTLRRAGLLPAVRCVFCLEYEDKGKILGALGARPAAFIDDRPACLGPVADASPSTTLVCVNPGPKQCEELRSLAGPEWAGRRSNSNALHVCRSFAGVTRVLRNIAEEAAAAAAAAAGVGAGAGAGANIGDTHAAGVGVLGDLLHQRIIRECREGLGELLLEEQDPAPEEIEAAKELFPLGATPGAAAATTPARACRAFVRNHGNPFDARAAAAEAGAAAAGGAAGVRVLREPLVVCFDVGGVLQGEVNEVPRDLVTRPPPPPPPPAYAASASAAAAAAAASTISPSATAQQLAEEGKRGSSPTSTALPSASPQLRRELSDEGRKLLATALDREDAATGGAAAGGVAAGGGGGGGGGSDTQLPRRRGGRSDDSAADRQVQRDLSLLLRSLAAAGFAQLPGSGGAAGGDDVAEAACWEHAETGTMLIVPSPRGLLRVRKLGWQACVEASSHSVSQEDLDEWLGLALPDTSTTTATNTTNTSTNGAGAPDLSGFGLALITWVHDYRFCGQAGGDDDDGGATADDDGGATAGGGGGGDGGRSGRGSNKMGATSEVDLSKLPTPAELGAALGGLIINEGRELTIMTWGDDLLSKAAVKARGAEKHFNAKPLEGRGGGADLKQNALEDSRIVRNVVSSMTFGIGARWLAGTVRQIEEGNLRCVSVFCSKGRHRSVSSAEILRARFYPKARVVHLTIR